MTSETETEHGVPDADGTEVAAGMSTWPRVCGTVPSPETWRLFPVCKQVASAWAMSAIPASPHTLFIYFPVFRTLGRDQKLPLPVL